MTEPASPYKEEGEAAIQVPSAIVQVVGILPVTIVREMAWPEDHRTVHLHPGSVQHILDRRTQQGAALVFKHLRASVETPLWFGVGDEGKLILVKTIAEHGERHVCTVVKHVPAHRSGAGTHELWIATGYPTDEQGLTRHLKRSNLKKVVLDR